MLIEIISRLYEIFLHNWSYKIPIPLLKTKQKKKEKSQLPKCYTLQVQRLLVV